MNTAWQKLGNWSYVMLSYVTHSTCVGGEAPSVSWFLWFQNNKCNKFQGLPSSSTPILLELSSIDQSNTKQRNALFRHRSARKPYWRIWSKFQKWSWMKVSSKKSEIFSSRHLKTQCLLRCLFYFLLLSLISGKQEFLNPHNWLWAAHSQILLTYVLTLTLNVDETIWNQSQFMTLWDIKLRQFAVLKAAPFPMMAVPEKGGCSQLKSGEISWEEHVYWHMCMK